MTLKNSYTANSAILHPAARGTLPFSKQALSRLESAIVQYEERILSALNEDLQKSHFEGYMTEIGMVKAELSYVQKRRVRWNRPQRVKTPLAQFPRQSVILREPYGSVLIMAPWNYPFQLCLEPLIGALAADTAPSSSPAPMPRIPPRCSKA